MKDDDTFKKVAKKVMEEQSVVLTELAKGPQGEYVHQLEERLKSALLEVKRLKRENTKLKATIGKLNES